MGPSTLSRRAWSLATLLLAIVAVTFAIVGAVSAFPAGLSVLACLAAAVGCAWYGICRRRLVRIIALALSAVLIAGALALIIAEGRLLDNLLVLAAVAGVLVAARMAFRVHVELPAAERPQHPVLFYNPLSGGGKATRFNLAEEARRRGITPVELHRGDDLAELVHRAVADGADALAMAGGDGSQAIVAMIAAELDLPYACIPAGTRNHFALDLGVDRSDVVGALDALVNGGERRVDLADVNGRVFVNNVSLGLYAEAVQRPGYRGAKLHTLLDTVPDVLGPDAQVPRLRWEGPLGIESAAAILVSNNPYRLGRPLGSGTRPHLDSGRLGVTVLVPMGSGGNGSVAHRLTMHQWTVGEFQVEADGPVPVGLDGEALQLVPPLRFRIHPRALRVRIAPRHPGASPSALEPETAWQTIGTVAGFALRGRPRETALR